SADGPPLDGNALLTAPFMKKPSPAQQSKLAEMARQIDKVQAALAHNRQQLKYLDPADAAQLGPEIAKMADDPARSFRTWHNQNRGKDGKGVPKEITGLLKQPKLDQANEKQLLDYYVQNVCA